MYVSRGCNDKKKTRKKGYRCREKETIDRCAPPIAFLMVMVVVVVAVVVGR